MDISSRRFEIESEMLIKPLKKEVSLHARKVLYKILHTDKTSCKSVAKWSEYW